MKRSRRVYELVKRVLDVALASIGLVVLSPLMVLLYVLVRANLGSPAIFRQKRPGKDGRLFTIYKFRTMHPAKDAERSVHAVASDAERLTPFGAKLRTTSLDELPEFWNVIKGDMSLIGPRPLLPLYLGRYNETQARRHEVRPGMTGWAQVNGRNAASWNDRLAMDVWYVDNRSFWLDLRIAGRTLKAILTGEGVSAPGSATMHAFDPDPRDDERRERR